MMNRTTRLLAIGIVLFPSLVHAEDVIEFLSGSKSRGRVVEIRKEKRDVVFESQVANRTFQRVYPYDKIHAVSYRGKRYVLNEKPKNVSVNDRMTRTKGEIQKLIDAAGRTPPDWYESTPLEYPGTLDLSWPQPPPQPWNNQKNVSQYLWDIINPNPNKWRSGIRLIHHLLETHKDDPARSKRAMQTLGTMYFQLLQDYPRAAFWWQHAGVQPATMEGVGLAECFWRLGSKPMALALLKGPRFRVESIKLLGDIGETRRALDLADRYARQVKQPQWALLAGGDACRIAGKYEKAIEYYERALNSDRIANESYDKRARDRARQSIEAIKAFELLEIEKVSNGTYRGESQGYEGPLEVSVTVQSGKLVDVEATKHEEKQFYSALRDVPQQIIEKQSVKNIDATSRATITAEAIISATAKALVGAEESSVGRRGVGD